MAKLEAELERSNSHLSTYESLAEKYRERMDYWQSETIATRAELEEVRAQLSSEDTQAATPISDLPDPADLLNQLKAQRKKSKADLADVEAILEMLEGST